MQRTQRMRYSSGERWIKGDKYVLFCFQVSFRVLRTPPIQSLLHSYILQLQVFFSQLHDKQAPSWLQWWAIFTAAKSGAYIVIHECCSMQYFNVSPVCVMKYPQRVSLTTWAHKWLNYARVVVGGDGGYGLLKVCPPKYDFPVSEVKSSGLDHLFILASLRKVGCPSWCADLETAF